MDFTIPQKINSQIDEDYEQLRFCGGYNHNFVIDKKEKGIEKTVYENRCAICLETQYFPDSINNKNFKSPILKAGEKYESTTIYKFNFM